MACHALPVAYKGGVKHRVTRRIGAARPRRRRADRPAGHGGIVDWNGAEPQQEGGHTRLLGGQQQFARGCQVKAFRIAPRRDDDSTRSADAKAVRSSLQHILRRRTAHDDEPLRIKPKVFQPRRIGKTMFLCGKILFQPDKRALTAGRAQGKGDDETRCCTRIVHFRRKDLMQCAALQPFAKHPVDVSVAETKGAARRLRFQRISLA